MIDNTLNWCSKNWLMCLVVVGLVLCVTGQLQPLVDNVMSMLGMEGMANSNGMNKNAMNHNKNGMNHNKNGMNKNGMNRNGPNKNGASYPMPAEEHSQSGQLAVDGTRVPSSCYPQTPLKPEELLPESETKAIQQFKSAAPKADGIMAVNMLDAGHNIGIDTVQQSLKNANRQLRSEPPNPQVNVSPWLNTTIGPDLMRRPLELNESCQ